MVASPKPVGMMLYIDARSNDAGQFFACKCISSGFLAEIQVHTIERANTRRPVFTPGAALDEGGTI